MMLQQFITFLKEYNIIALAVAFIMGAATNDVVKSLVENLIMPFVTPLFGNERWESIALTLGPITLRFGVFIADLLQFVVLAWVVFVIVKYLLKQEEVKKV